MERFALAALDGNTLLIVFVIPFIAVAQSFVIRVALKKTVFARNGFILAAL